MNLSNLSSFLSNIFNKKTLEEKISLCVGFSHYQSDKEKPYYFKLLSQPNKLYYFKDLNSLVYNLKRNFSNFEIKEFEYLPKDDREKIKSLSK